MIGQHFRSIIQTTACQHPPPPPPPPPPLHQWEYFLMIILQPYLESDDASLASVIAQFCLISLLVVSVLESKVLTIPDPARLLLTPGTSLQCPIHKAILAIITSSVLERRLHNVWRPENEMCKYLRLYILNARFFFSFLSLNKMRNIFPCKM